MNNNRRLSLPVPPDPPRVKEAKDVAKLAGANEPSVVNWCMRMIEARDDWVNRLKGRRT